MKSLLILFLFFSAGISISSQDFVKGVVYNDLNGNQMRDKDEPGIFQVPVSNGADVVLTDENGEYTLPLSQDDIIFVIKPAGYSTPFNEQNLPLFYYIHKPLGSPGLNYRGVDPTGMIPESVDFALYPVPRVNQFDVLLFGDPQPYSKEELEFFDQRIVSELSSATNFSFGISMGDLSGDNPDLFEPYNEIIRNVGIPWYNVIGNHDMNFDVSADSLSDESFERVFGPSSYSFNMGKAHFIILKNILRPDPRNPANKGYWGGFTEKQFTFVENDLKYVPEDHLIVLSFHIPIWEGYVDRDIFRDADRERLFSLLEDYPYTLSISAHSHIQNNKLMNKEHGWTQDKPHHHFNIGTTCGSWYRGELDSLGIPFSVMADGTPQGYALLRIDNNRYNITYKAAGHDMDYQMNIYHPKVMGHAKKSLSNIYVNFFMGNENDEVMFRVDKNEWIPMSYTIEFDPSYLHRLHQWDFTNKVIPGRRPVEARQCSHLWKALLPSDLDIGEHSVEIKVKDMFGNLHYGKSAYRIALP